jgi:hypothetical protein
VSWSSRREASRGPKTPRFPSSPASTPLDPSSLAVLYFDDFSPGGELEYLANGITEALIQELSRLRPLRVVSRNGVKPFRDPTIPVDSLARILGVGSLVQGSVEGVRSSGSPGAHVQYFEANVRLRLGQTEKALRLLEGYLEAMPHRRAYIARDWWWEPLRSDPGFRRMVEEGPDPADTGAPAGEGRRPG